MARILLKHKFTILSLFLFIIVVQVESLKFSTQLSPKSYGPKEDMKLTHHLGLFLHQRNSGDHPTVMEVAKGAKTDTYSSKFGLTVVKDEELREGLEPTSKIVGRAQGIGSYVGLEEPAFMYVYNYVFLEGIYNESSLSVVGRNPISPKVFLHEFSIVGGTGKFLDARGHLLTGTIDKNPSSGDGIDFHDVYVYQSK